MEFVAIANFLQFVLAGAGVGFLVGLTGVGGGSLMTPLLILFNFPPHIAIGTDLIYAAGTKAGGVVAHTRLKTIEWGKIRKWQEQVPKNAQDLANKFEIFENTVNSIDITSWLNQHLQNTTILVRI